MHTPDPDLFSTVYNASVLPGIVFIVYLVRRIMKPTQGHVVLASLILTFGILSAMGVSFLLGLSRMDMGAGYSDAVLTNYPLAVLLLWGGLGMACLVDSIMVRRKRRIAAQNAEPSKRSRV